LTKIIIVFIGLIVQVNQPGLLNTAVLPSGERSSSHHGDGKAHPHTAALEIRYADIEEPHPSLKPNQYGYSIISLKGVQMEVEGTRGWFSRMSRELQDSLPPLRKLDPSCELRQEVIDRSPTRELQAFVDFRGGRRRVEDYLPRTLTISAIEWNDRCMACGVAYESDLRGEFATLKLKGHDVIREIRLKPGAKIFVKNMPANPKERHFDLLYEVYKDCSRKPVPVPQQNDCTKPNRCGVQETLVTGGPTAPGADCTGGNG
jgi:hypothetical protein